MYKLMLAQEFKLLANKKKNESQPVTQQKPADVGSDSDSSSGSDQEVLDATIMYS